MSVLGAIEFQLVMPKEAIKTLVMGKMIVRYGNKNIKVSATSGCPRYQYLGADKLPGRGPLPGCKDVGIVCYMVNTTPVYLPNVRGIEGNGYPIAPFWVTIGGVRRGDFLVHADRNLPGSAGCAVVDVKHWDVVEDAFADMRKLGIKACELKTIYSYL